MNKDFERCCSFLADMIIKYAPEIKEEVEVCMMIKDSIDDEKVMNLNTVQLSNLYESDMLSIQKLLNFIGDS